jgi:PEP-CTERM motif
MFHGRAAVAGKCFYVGIGFALLAVTATVARADLIAYDLTTSNQFGTVDLNTGVSTLIGLTGGPVLTGLGEVSGSLYGGSSGGHTLYSINPATGDLSVVGNGTVTYAETGSTTAGLFAIDTLDNLWSINPSTGASTLIGPTGIGAAGFVTLSTNSSTLYYVDAGNLYTLNTSTGHANLVGSNGSLGIAAMVFEGGSLYAGVDSPALQIDTINPATGQGSLVAPVTGPLLGFDGLAPVPASAVPEPGSLGMLAGGIAGMVLLRRRLT